MRLATLVGAAIAAMVCVSTQSVVAAEVAVGLSAVDITPDYPIRLSGFGFRRSESDGVTQKIWAKAIAIGGDDAAGPAVIVTVDSIGVPATVREAVAQRLAEKAKLDPSRLAITSSHSHTTPMVGDVLATLFGQPVTPEEKTRIERYTRELTDRIEQAAVLAIADRKPATIAFGIGTGGLAMNRRRAGGPVDHDLPMLAIRDAAGALRGVYVSYACHCVTLSYNRISGDWAGYLQASLQADHPGAIALTSIGCGADINPNSGVTGGNVDVAAAQGRALADEVNRMLKAGALTPITQTVEAKAAEVELMFDTPPTREAFQKIADANQEYVSYHAKVQIERLDRGEALQTKLPYLIQTFSFGDELAMVFLPGEVVVDYSMRLKSEFDRSRLWINAYSNDVPCYIPSERILKEGGYEGGGAMTFYDRPAPLATGVEKTIVDEVHRQLPAAFRTPEGTEGVSPKTPQASLRSMRARPSMEVELVAAEPLVTSPVAIDWGADGKLWVCEMYDYPTGVDNNWQPGGRVKCLEDADGDGKYDKATVFLEGLPFPTGVTAWGKGVYVCAAPDILYAQDTDGDGKADTVEKVFTGFATDNYQARVNSLTLGLDNYLYGANGLLGGTISDAAKTQSLDIRNHDFRFRPGAGKLETVSGLTQQGRARDDWGRWFGCNNSAAMLYYPHEQRYISRNPHAPAPPATVIPPGNYEIGRVFPISRQLERYNNPESENSVTAGCGLGVYRDTLLGDEVYGNVFVCEPTSNVVHRMIPIEDAGGKIIARKRAADESASEFLASTDNWFRPVQARPGPDGAMYVVDMYRFLIEHPRWIPAERLAKLDARAGSDKGRIYRVKPQDKPLHAIRDLTKLSSKALAEAIDSPNGIERDRVHAELLNRNDPDTAAALRKIARESKLASVRVQTLSALDGIGGLTAEDVSVAIKDGDPRVRAHAVRLSEATIRNVDLLADLVNDPSAIVRHQLAYTLGMLDDPKAGALLAALAKASPDDAEMRIAVLSSAGGTHVDAVLQAVMAMPMDAPGRDAWLPPLVATAAASGNEALLGMALSAVLPKDSQAPTPTAFDSLASLLDAIDRRKASLPADAAGKLAGAIASARQTASEASAASPLRIAALKVLGRGDTPAEELDLLCRLAADNDEAVRTAALAALRRQTSSAVAAQLLKSWRQISPAARPAIVQLLLEREGWTVALLEAVKKNVVVPSEVSLADRQRLSGDSVGENIRTLAASVFPSATLDATRQAVLDRYAGVAKLIGDPGRGAAVFAEQCAQCHLLNGVGHAIGPDMAALRDRDADYFVKNILDPSAIVEPRFTHYQVVLKDRRVISGLIAAESAGSLTLQAGGGASETVARADVKDIRASKISMMPEGLEAAIPPERMADLVAFLKSGEGTRRILAGNTPRTIKAAKDGSLLLAAANAEIFGETIRFETEFQNIGHWNSASDYVAWNIRVDRAGAYDVHLDFACAESAAGNGFVLAAGPASLNGIVAATGPDWSTYTQAKVGAIRLEAGDQRIVLRPSGQVRNALMDLRTLALTPKNVKPKWKISASGGVSADGVARDAASVARTVLDPKVPAPAREAAINANPQFAAELILEMTRDLAPGSPAEYERIPWIWRVAIACGKRDDAGEMKAVLDVSLPKAGEPLRDWQSVVIGGGIINGISLRGEWPAPRIAEIIGEDESLLARWHRSIELADAMADDDKVPPGTRYDALRMLGVESWEKRGAHLARYLAKGTNGELQQGAVSGLADVDSPHATAALLAALPDLTPANRAFALDALLRGEARMNALRTAVAEKKVTREELGPDRTKRLFKE